LRLSSIGEKVHDDGSPVDGLLDRKQSLSWHLDRTSQKHRQWPSKMYLPSHLLGPASNSHHPCGHQR
jgi:hypothetical protein